MMSFRRLRAVLIFSTVSAFVWGVASVLISIAYALRSGRPFASIAFVPPFVIFAFCGFVAGAIYSVGIGMVPLKRDQPGLSAGRSGFFGVIAGTMVFLAITFGLGDRGTRGVLFPTAIFGAIGGVTGLLIQRVARRGALPPGATVSRSISAGDDPALDEG